MKPQMEGLVYKIYNIKPRKPNSGFRKILEIIKNNIIYKAYLPGEGRRNSDK